MYDATRDRHIHSYGLNGLGGSPRGVLSGGLWGALAGAKVVENIRKYQATHLNEWFDFSLLLKGSRVSLWGSLGR